jgi:hypothetical protein
MVLRMEAKQPDRISEAELRRLGDLAEQASSAPWTAFVGPGIGGEDFIRVSEDDAEPDMYVSREGRPAAPADLEFIAAARNVMPDLVKEVLRGRPGRHFALHDAGKKPFLAVYDYGTGGIWIYLYALSAEQIIRRYPGLTVITEWSEWMTPARVLEIVAHIGSNMTFDIDEPDGWLASAEGELGRRDA